MEAAKSVTSTEVASNASETVALSGKIVTSRRKGRLFFVFMRTQNKRRHHFSRRIFLVYSVKTATIFLMPRKKQVSLL